MEEHFNYANLLSFVQVGVAMNFGLLYLNKKNVFASIYKEYQGYLEALSKACLNKAAKQTGRVRIEMGEIIGMEKAMVDHWKSKIKYTYEHEFDYPYLACWGICSGTYGFFFLLAVGLFGCYHDKFLMDFIIVLSELVCITELVSYISVYNIREEMEKKKRVFWTCLSFFVAIWGVLTCVQKGWIYRMEWNMDICFLVSMFVAYTPVIWLILMALERLARILLMQVVCYWHAARLRMLLDARKNLRKP